METCQTMFVFFLFLHDANYVIKRIHYQEIANAANK